MYDMDTVKPTPEDLGTRKAFHGVVVFIPALIEAATAGNTPIEGRRFTDCVIMGPAILSPGAGTLFNGCNFGDVGGDPRNLLVRPAGSMIIGALSVAGCVFEGCLLNGVGLVGDDGFIERFLGGLNKD